jgi:hypothetical protein
MRRLAVLSLHTSPLAQPGLGDGGGMNVYVRELSSALARAGVECDVFTRAWADDLPATVDIEPGFRVHHVSAGPPPQMAKEELPQVVEEFADGVLKRMQSSESFGPDRGASLRRRARQLLAERHGRAHHQAPVEPAAGLHLPHPRPGQGRGQPRGGRGRRLPSAGRSRGHHHPLLGHRAGLVLGGGRPDLRAVPRRPLADPDRGPRGRSRLLRPRGPAPGPAGPGPASKGPLLLFVGRIQPLKGAAVAVRTWPRSVPRPPRRPPGGGRGPQRPTGRGRSGADGRTGR